VPIPKEWAILGLRRHLPKFWNNLSKKGAWKLNPTNLTPFPNPGANWCPRINNDPGLPS